MNFLKRLFGHPRPSTKETAEDVIAKANAMVEQFKERNYQAMRSAGFDISREQFDEIQRQNDRSASLMENDPDDDAHRIVGESNYQDALEAIAGAKSYEGHNHSCFAILRPEPDNPFDENAVFVMIADQKVGYLSRGDAMVMRRFLDRTGFDEADCYATIIGGWKNERSEGSFGVELDIHWPPKLSD